MDSLPLECCFLNRQARKGHQACSKTAKEFSWPHNSFLGVLGVLAV